MIVPSVPQWDPNFGKNIANNIVSSGKIYSKSVPAGKMPIPTKIKSSSHFPSSYKIGSPVRIKSIHQRCSVKSNFIKKETLAQRFSYEFCEFPRTPFFTEHLQATASEEHT